MIPRSFLIAAIIAGAAVAYMAGSPVKTARTGDDVAAAPPPPTANAEKERPRVQIRPSHAADHTDHVTVQGRTEPWRAVVVKAKIGGRVAAIPVTKGQAVTQGTLLVKLDDEDRPARLQSARAAVQHRRDAYQAAQKLARNNFRSSINVAESLAALRAAEAEQALIEQQIADSRITAPFSGVLEALPVEVGDYLAPGTAVATVVELDPLKVVGHVTERQVGRLSTDQPAEVTLVNGARRQAVITFVAREADPNTRTYRVEARLGNPDQTLPAGMTAQLSIPLTAVSAHALSPAYLALNDTGRIGVKVLDDQDRVVFQPVRVLAQDKDQVWVAGLPAEIRLITVGAGYVSEGEKVIARPMAGEPAP